MRLVTKINLALVGVVAVSAVLNFAALRMAVMPSFAALEELAADQNQSRVLEAVELQKEQVANSTGDYAIWDDTYELMNGRAEDYEAKNVTAESLKTLGVNYFVALDNEGRVVIDSGFVHDGEEPQPVKLNLADAVTSTGPLVTASDKITVQSALMRTDQGLVAIGFSPILRSDRSGERAGTLVLGRILDLDDIKTATKVDFEMLRGDEGAGQAGSSDDAYLRRVDQLDGLDGQPAATLVSRTSRDITSIGKRTILTTMAFLLGAAALLLIALAFALRKIAVSRIEKLRSHLTDVALTGNLQILPEDGKGDELSETLQSFNEMARQLAELRAKLRKQDYEHGAADQAAGLLHNVRNAMSPVSALAWELSRQSETASQQNLAKAVNELKDPNIPADRASKLNQFVLMSAERLIENESTRRDNLRSMVAMLRHIDEILREADRSAQLDRVLEPIDLEASIRDAMRLVQGKDGIDVDFTSLSATRVEGHKVPLDQVIANILVNATEAIEASGKISGHIVITSEHSLAEQGELQVVLRIRDDGVGIEQAKLARIFEKGFSTKSDGKRGLGLHWCANAINAMGGKIVAESAGLEKGATLTITLSAQKAEKAAA